MRHLLGGGWCEQLLCDEALEFLQSEFSRLNGQFLPQSTQSQTWLLTVLGRGGSGRLSGRMFHLREQLPHASDRSTQPASIAPKSQFWAKCRHPDNPYLRMLSVSAFCSLWNLLKSTSRRIP